MPNFNYRNIRSGPKKNIDIKDLITKRLSLQSNKRQLETEFHMHPEEVVSDNLYHATHYAEWDENKRENFIQLICGPIYYKLGKSYFDNKVKQLKHQV